MDKQTKMIKVIMCGHGQLAIAMKASVEMVYGDAHSLYPLAFEKHEGREDLEQKMKDLLDGQKKVLILVDLFGGTPFNAAATLAFSDPNIEVVTGMSLPLCLELVDNLDQLDLSALVEHLLDVGQQCVKQLNKAPITDEDDFI